MIREARPLAEITTEAIRILYREIGIVDTLRFVGQYTRGHGDYTAQREQVFAGMSLNEIISEIRQSRKRQRRGRGEATRQAGAAPGKAVRGARTGQRRVI